MEHEKKDVKAQNGQSIRTQIQRGYLLLTAIIIFLVVTSVILLTITEKANMQITVYRQQQYNAEQVVSAHYKWLEQLSESITLQTNFTGSLDPATCALGNWLKTAQDDLSSDTFMKQALDEIIQPHQDIHLTAEELVALSKSDQAAAYQIYSDEMKPKVMQIGDGLTKISSRYQEIANEMQESTHNLALVSYVLLALAGVIAILISIMIGRRVSARISSPIMAVARWSEELSTGVDNLHFDAEQLQNPRNAVEVNQMIHAFQDMADGIRENVKVIQRIASGDLTAFVEIKSRGDSLGQNLYHLVQNNDMMFADLLRVADSVANHAQQISSSSQVLAQSSSEQAQAVEVLSSTVEEANSLAQSNADSSSNAASVIGKMKQEMGSGQDKMNELLKSMDDIASASNQISVVMKSINDIAFQTNILALNAAVEAARAGTAGKGFAVVADEVRNLALKCSEAADQSRHLIENSISKTDAGAHISREASDIFGTIVEHATEIADVVEKINTASWSQQKFMAEIHEEIQKISAIVADNAASSETTAAATKEMDLNADSIRQSMRKFNLRKREQGKPYIPPEKADDEEFIQQAYENFQKTKGTTNLHPQ